MLQFRKANPPVYIVEIFDLFAVIVNAKQSPMPKSEVFLRPVIFHGIADIGMFSPTGHHFPPVG
jgi:hypothetical protein